MLGSYIRTAVRHILRHKLYSFINIGGLAVGLAACILILLFVRDEVSYDSWLPEIERVHRMEVTFYPPGRAPLAFVNTPGPARDPLMTYFEGKVEEAARIYRSGHSISTGDRTFNERVAYVDDNFFELFRLPMVAGEREAAVRDSNSLIVSEAMAEKFFGSEPAVGKTITFDNETDYRVVGVFKDIPSNSHLVIDFIVYFDLNRYTEQLWVAESWLSANVHTYIKTAPGVSIDEINAAAKDFVNANVTIDITGFTEISPSDVMALDFISVPDIHLHATKPGGMKPPGSIAAVYIFSAVAGLILLIACINFMNLATARALQRAREVSMRKVLGARREQLIKQFLGEATVTTILALLVAVALVELALPAYNDFLGKTLEFNLFTDAWLAGGLVALIVIVGVISGSYPAFVLSNFRPARVLHSGRSASDSGSKVRGGLVVLQFAISIGLILSTGVVYGQMVYAQSMNLGFDKSQKVTLRGLQADQIEAKAATIGLEMAKLPGVKGVAYASDTIPQRSNNNTIVDPPQGQGGDPLVIEQMVVGIGFFELYQVQPLAGRLFSENFRGDLMPPRSERSADKEINLGIIINESSLSRIGALTPEDAIGQVLSMEIGLPDNQTGKAFAKIVGVIPDMHLRSVRFDVAPMLFLAMDNRYLGNMSVELEGGQITQTLAAIDNLWAQLVPEVPVAREFVDERIAGLYTREAERARMFAGFALFAVLVACLGLYGLASFAAERRTKEIGLRKVLGASVGDIVKMLLWQFSKPVLIANLIAWPVAFYFMSGWLDGFIYRIDISVLPVMATIAGLLALFVAWATVAAHAARVARSSPIRALRYE
jgi:putative ABC transport system permease protein